MRSRFYSSLTISIFFLLIASANFYSQPKNNTQNNSVTGRVVDLQTNTPIEFATVVLIRRADSTQVTGAATDTKGQFVLENVPAGTYFMRISYVGYKNHLVKSFKKENGKPVSLGKISLTPSDMKMNDIVVSGTRSPISYQIDKKVISVGENLSTISGTAVDVLENVPSITVDIDGNVSLRGSGNFQVLIDGRPTILDPNEALQQIQASSIENIEIITNPSAKYDPEGTAGIINIIMKKTNKWGITSLFNLNLGVRNKYGGDATADFRNNFIQANLGIGYNNRVFFGTQNENNWNNADGQTYYYKSDGTSNHGNESFNLRGSVSFDFGAKRLLTLGGRYNNRSHSDNSALNYSQWNTMDPAQQYFISKSEGSRSGHEISVFGNYKHPFNDSGHELVAEVHYDAETSDESSTNKLFSGEIITDGKTTTENGPGNELQTKLDYTLPFTSVSKFEAGYQGTHENSDDKTGLLTFNPATQLFENNSLYDNHSKYAKNDYALYSIYTSKIDSLGYKLGVRTEYTGRDIEVPEMNEKFSIDRWDYFPSAHFSFGIGAGYQLMASYTRRINRPRDWQMEPFQTWIDAYNVRVGNPSLQPEYIDSYELGFQTLIGNSVFSIDTYYRQTKNKIERVLSVYSETVTLQTTKNIGKDYSLGVELFSNFDPIKNWNVNLMGNIYNYKIEGSPADNIETNQSFNWNARFNNSIKIAENTQVQVNVWYNSPSATSQGNREGFFITNFAIKQQLFDKLITATLQVRDILGTAKFQIVNQSPDFYSLRHFERESPMVMLNLRLNLSNNSNNDHGEEGMQNNNGGDDQGGMNGGGEG